MRSPVLTLKNEALAGVSTRSLSDATRRLAIVAVTLPPSSRRCPGSATTKSKSRVACDLRDDAEVISRFSHSLPPYVGR
jgi:hypothetical protein